MLSSTDLKIPVIDFYGTWIQTATVIASILVNVLLGNLRQSVTMGDIDCKIQRGFTLIELSIVLVIIGLIVGGVLVGQDLIRAAGVRAQVSQIEKYNTAVNTFKGRYGYLPGDIPDPNASSFGFAARGAYPGMGDGNGIIQTNCSSDPVGTWVGSGQGNMSAGCGELAMFWVDLSTANLIDAGIKSFGNGACAPYWGNCGGYVTFTSTPYTINNWIPAAKIGNGNYVYLFALNNQNYYTIAPVTSIQWTVAPTNGPGLTVRQAYMMDSKVDDGLPQSGNVLACYSNSSIDPNQPSYAAAGLLQGATGSGPYPAGCIPTTAATSYLSTDCFDNNGVAGPQTYAVSKNGNLTNCALSFRFQ